MNLVENALDVSLQDYNITESEELQDNLVEDVVSSSIELIKFWMATVKPNRNIKVSTLNKLLDDMKQIRVSIMLELKEETAELKDLDLADVSYEEINNTLILDALHNKIKEYQSKSDTYSETGFLSFNYLIVDLNNLIVSFSKSEEESNNLIETILNIYTVLLVAHSSIYNFKDYAINTLEENRETSESSLKELNLLEKALQDIELNSDEEDDYEYSYENNEDYYEDESYYQEEDYQEEQDLEESEEETQETESIEQSKDGVIDITL